MTSIGEISSKNPRSLANEKIEKSHSLTRDKKAAKYLGAKSIPLRSSNISASPTSSVRMYLRVKPASAVANGAGGEGDVYRVLDSATLLTKFPSFDSGKGRGARLAKSGGDGGRRHTFTKIFGSETSQAKMFDGSIKHRVADFLGGKSSTIMTYGTRDSGKTYTLFGGPESPGIIPRSIDLVFSAINCTLTPWYKPTCRDTLHDLDEITQTLETRRKARVLNERSMERVSSEARRSLENSQTEDADREGCEERNGASMCAVWLSLAEIYNGNIYDLLDEDATVGSPLKLTADNEGQAYVCGLQRVYATTALEACQILMAGRSKLTRVATPSNPRGSRSHTIFTMELLKYRKERAADEVAVSTLAFCDLAGSTQFEKRQKGSCMREASNINNSLVVLGRCLKAVSQNQVAPFRESKLTRLFQRALSGQEDLTLIVNIVFTPNLHIETQNTLNFCVIARKLLTESRKGYKQSCELEESLSSPDSDVAASPLVCQTLSEVARTSDCTDSIAYEDIREENERLIKELEAMKVDTLNREFVIRQELAYHYSRMMEQLETTYKEHAEKIEAEKDDLLKWSTKQVEKCCKTRIDSLMPHKKRKRGDCGDYIDDNHAFYEDLEAENTRITSKVVALKEAVKKLKKDNKTILSERNKCSFELALMTEELKKFQEQARAKIRKWGGDEENIDDTADCLIRNLEQLMDEKVRATEKELEETSEYICMLKSKNAEAASGIATIEQELTISKNLLDEASSKVRELEEELSRKEAHIVTLNHRVHTQEEQLAQVQRRFDELEDENVKSLRDKCDKSTNISFDDSILDRLFDGNASISSAEKNLQTPISSRIEQREVSSTITVTKLFATQVESPKKKLSNISNIDDESFLELSGSTDYSASRSSDTSSKNDSGVSSGIRGRNRRSTSISDSTRISERENKCTQTCHFEKYSCVVAEGSAERPKVNCENSKRRKQQEASQKVDKLTVEDEGNNQTSKCLERYIERYKSFEEQVSSMRYQLDKLSDECESVHLSRVDSKEKGIRKFLQMNELDRKIAWMQQNFAVSFELFEKVSDFEIIVGRWQKDKTELHRQLYEHSNTQLTLENKLQQLTIKTVKKGSDFTFLSNIDMCELTNLSAASNEKTRNMIKQIGMIGEGIGAAERDLQCSEDLRKSVENIMKKEINSFRSWFSDYKDNAEFFNEISKAYDNSQNEISRLSMRLQDKEREIALLKGNMDIAKQNYNILKGYLQYEIEERNKQLNNTVYSHGSNDFEESFIEERNELYKVFDSIKKVGVANNRGD